MKITTTVKAETKIELTTFKEGDMLKSHDCELYGWWGNETCQKVDLTEIISGSCIPDGEYKVVITLEKI